MGALQPWHVILIVVVFLLLFGGKKLPDAARGLGRSLRILKSEVGAMHEEDAKAKPVSETDQTSTVATAPSQIAPAPITPAPIQQPTVQVPNAAPVAAPVVSAPAFHAPAAQPIVVPVSVPQPVINVPMNGQPH